MHLLKIKYASFYVSLTGHNNIFIFQQNVFIFSSKKQKVYFLKPFIPFVGNPFLPSEKGYYVAVKPAPDRDFF